MSWIAAVLATLLMPRGSSAYGSFQLLPYVGVTEVFDDNLFGVPSGGTTVTSAPPANSSAPPTTTHQNRESDFITRFTPGLEGTIQRGLFSLTGGYHFDSDIYAEHSEFTSGFAAQAGDIDATYEISRALTASLLGTYAEAESGQALSGGTSPFLLTQNQQFVTGVQTARGRSEAFSVGPTVNYRMDAATTIDTTYRFSGSDQVGGSRSETNQGSVQLNRTLTPVDTGQLCSIRLRARRFREALRRRAASRIRLFSAPSRGAACRTSSLLDGLDNYPASRPSHS